MTIGNRQEQHFSQTPIGPSPDITDKQKDPAKLSEAFGDQKTQLEMLTENPTALDRLRSTQTTTELLLIEGLTLTNNSRPILLDAGIGELPITPTTTAPTPSPHADPEPDNTPTPSPHADPEPDNTPTPSPHADPEPDNTPTPSPHAEPEPDNTPTPSPHADPEPDNTPTPSPHADPEPDNTPTPDPEPDNTPTPDPELDNTPTPSPHPETETPTPNPLPGHVVQVPSPTPTTEQPATTAPPDTHPELPSLPTLSDLFKAVRATFVIGPVITGLGGLLYPSPLGNGDLTPDQIANENGMNALSEEEVQEAVNELADEYPDYTPEEIGELVKEPDGTVREVNIQEVKAGLEAEKLGLIEGPLQPSDHVSHDFRAGDPPQDWDVKGYNSEYPFDADEALNDIERKDLPNGENILFDTTNMTEEDIVALENELANRPGFDGRYEFVPPR